MKTSKLVRDSGVRSLIVGIILASITAVMLVLVGKNAVTAEIKQVLTLISGLTTIASLAAFKQFIQSGQSIDDSVNNAALIKLESEISQLKLEISRLKSKSELSELVDLAQSFPSELEIK